MKDAGDTNYIYKNELDKACFERDMAYEDFKDLARRTAYYKVLRDKGFNIVKNPKYDAYIRGFASMVCKCFDKWQQYQKMYKLEDIVNEYNNTNHTTIKKKPVDVKDNTYIDFKKEVDDHVTISKYKNIFAKVYTPNWSEEVFVIKKVKNTIQWLYVISDLNDNEIIGTS